LRLFAKLGIGLAKSREPRPVGVLNLGGMANLTLLAEAGGENLSFDTGPAGSLLDGLARRLLDAPLDRDGACAGAGRADEESVRACLEHPFFDRAPPVTEDPA